MDLSLVEPSVIVAAIAAVEGVGVSVIGGLFAHFSRRSERRAEENRRADLAYREERDRREQARQERDAALYGVVLSTARGTEVLLHQAHGDHLNGNVEEALDSMGRAISKFNNVANAEIARL